MNYLLLTLSVLLDTFKNSYSNHFSKNLIKTNRDNMLFNAVLSFGAVLFFIFAGASLKISAFSLILALIFALVTLAAQLTLILSLASGPMSYSVLFTYLGGILIPTAYSVILGQKPSVFQYIGLLFMMITVFTSASLKKEKKITGKWLFFSLTSLVMWGCVGICQQIHQSSQYKDEILGFLFWAFVIMTAIFLSFFLLSKKEDSSYKLISKSSIYILFAGLGTGAINLINLYLSVAMKGIIFFPIVNGGVIILSGLVAILIFKEKLDRNQATGIIAGTVAVVLLCI